jgi:hypothetical protein
MNMDKLIHRVKSGDIKDEATLLGLACDANYYEMHEFEDLCRLAVGHIKASKPNGLSIHGETLRLTDNLGIKDSYADDIRRDGTQLCYENIKPVRKIEASALLLLPHDEIIVQMGACRFIRDGLSIYVTWQPRLKCWKIYGWNVEDVNAFTLSKWGLDTDETLNFFGNYGWWGKLWEGDLADALDELVSTKRR